MLRAKDMLSSPFFAAEILSAPHAAAPVSDTTDSDYMACANINFIALSCTIENVLTTATIEKVLGAFAFLNMTTCLIGCG
ncbi:hypothetical protein GGE67_001968 [Rhizobium leucaenae]|uniref:Uncharacterized protein n=1 Tax=Rhizobium leucaenae TaxID=29450 RepID=A0A7W7EIY1_9HYPH|nr:hypothetical protein [Rhizobium leucaenae]MBB6301359.1 hypothetical protein [Rhizobium leucaenae]